MPLQEYNTANENSLGGYLPAGTPDTWHGQTWLALSSYLLTSIRLKLWRGYASYPVEYGTLYCDIFEATDLWLDDTYNIIAPDTLLGTSVAIDVVTALPMDPAEYTWYEIEFSPSVAIVQGNYYGMSLRRPEATTARDVYWRGNSVAQYADGIRCWSYDAGDTWLSYTQHNDVNSGDWVFEIYGEAVDDDMAGTSVCASSSTGTLELVTPLQGTTVGSSQSTGALIAAKALAGTCSIAAATSGVLVTIKSLSGTCTVVATTSGTCINTKVLNGQIDAFASTLATLSLSTTFSGQSQAVSSSDGLLTNAKLLTAITSILSDSSGLLLNTKVFNGQIAVISGTSGILNKLSALTGQVNTLSSAGGILNSVKGLSGTVLATSQIPPVLLYATRLLIGQSSAIAVSIGSIDVFKTLEAISTIISGSEADLWRRLGLKGHSDSLSTSLGTLILSCGLAGQSTCISSSSGYLQSLLQLFGLSASQSSSTGLLLANLINLAGQIDALSSSSGDAIRIPGLFGLIHATSFSTSHLRTIVRGKSNLNAISQLSGYLTGQLALSGQTDVLSGSEATIERLTTEFLVHSFSIIPILETSRLRLNEEILLR